MPVLNGPIEVRDTKAVDKEIADFKSALDNASPDKAFVPAVTPGHVAFNFPNRYYKSHQQIYRGGRSRARSRIQSDR
jgi:hypothetical protein